MKKQTVMVYLKKDNTYCFLVRDKKNDTVHKQGMLLSIGGKVEAGESIIDAAKRETYEESGVTVNTLDLRAVLYFRNFGIEQHDWVSFLFVSDDFTGQPMPGNEGSFVWHDLAKIHELQFYDMDKAFLDLLNKHRFFVADFLCNGHELLAYSVLQAL